MNKKELILHTLEKMGYKPEIDGDGDISVRYQMKSIFVFVGDEEDSYVAVLLPQFHEIAEGEESLENSLDKSLQMLGVVRSQFRKNKTELSEG